MADDVSVKDSSDVARVIATDEVAGRNYQIVKNAFGSADAVTLVDASNGLPVAILGTVPVSGTVGVSGNVEVVNDVGNPLPVSAASLPLPAGAATETTLAAIGTKTPALGVAAEVASVPVAMATEQSLDAYVTGQGSQLTLGNNVLLAAAGSGSADCQRYRSIVFSIIPAAGTVTAGAITFEGSNDNVNFVAVPMYDVASPQSLPISTYTIVAATNRHFAGTALFRYMRARISTGITGTTTGVQAFTILSMAPFFPFGPVQVASQTGTNNQANVSHINGVAPLMGNGVTGTGSLRVTLASDTTANSNPLLTKRPTPTQSFVNSAATTNATSVKASAGGVFGVIANNNGAAAAFVKFYNKASAPTVGTDVPVFIMTVPAGGHAELNFGAYGHQFGTGIALAITNLVADTDTTAVAAAQVKVSTSYL